jgi:hypothetical protein
MEEPPYKKNLERLAALQDRLSKVQKTAESLLATVSGSGGDYTDKLVYTDVSRASKFLEKNKVDEIFYTVTVGRIGAARRLQLATTRPQLLPLASASLAAFACMILSSRALALLWACGWIASRLMRWRDAQSHANPLQAPRAGYKKLG